MLLDARRLVERATRWLLRNRRRPLDIAATVECFSDGARAVAGALPGILAGDDRAAWDARVEELSAARVPGDVARRVAGLWANFSALDIVAVATAAGRSVEDVAALHFELGARLHLHWLRDRIAALPRENRWQAMARAALRDDLFSLHAELTADVLQGAPADTPAEGRLDAWLAENAGPAERTLGVLEDIRTSGSYDLTTLPVALREVRDLIRAGAPQPAPPPVPEPTEA
jgi:glutamate dehydrogenase